MTTHLTHSLQPSVPSVSSVDRSFVSPSCSFVDRHDDNPPDALTPTICALGVLCGSILRVPFVFIRGSPQPPLTAAAPGATAAFPTSYRSPPPRPHPSTVTPPPASRCERTPAPASPSHTPATPPADPAPRSAPDRRRSACSARSAPSPPPARTTRSRPPPRR